MIKKLKTNRHVCQVAIDEDEEELKWIEREEKAIHVRLDPLVERLREREETAERVRAQIAQAVEMFNGVRFIVRMTPCHVFHRAGVPGRLMYYVLCVARPCCQILSTTNSRITATRMKSANHRKAEARDELRAARGFSASAAESPHRTRPKGYFKRTK